MRLSAGGTRSCGSARRAAITAIAWRAARRQGLADHRRLVACFRAAVGVALARRSARAVHACSRWPPEQGWQ